MYVHGQLLRAQLENSGSDYATTLRGGIWLNTVTNRVNFADGTVVKSFLLNDDKIIVGTNGTAATNVRLFRAGTGVLQFALGNDVTAEGTLAISVAQVSSRVENYTFAGRPAPGNPGRIIWVTDQLKNQVDTGAAWIDISGGTGSDNSELFRGQLAAEHSNIFSTQLLYGIGSSFQKIRTQWQASLIENYTASSTDMKIVVNPLIIPTNATTGWTGNGGAGSITTSATTKTDALSLQFAKDNSTTYASVQYNPTDGLGVSLNKNFWVFVNLSTVTQVTSICLQLSKDTGFTDAASWNITTNYAGAALAIGWNLLHLNLDTTPTAVIGAGWLPDEDTVVALQIGPRTSAAGQTATVLLSAFTFADSTGLYTEKGETLTIYNASTRDEMQIDVSSLDYQGVIILTAALANSYSALTTTKIYRTIPDIGLGRCTPVAGLSGTVSLTQEVRLAKYFPAVVPSADVSLTYAFGTQKILKIKAVGGASIDVYDPNDNHLQFVTGNKLRAITAYAADGTGSFAASSVNPTLTGNATHASGVTTIPVAVAGLSVGMYIFKEQITPYVSLGNAGTNESWQAMTFDSIIVESIGAQYPAQANLFANWNLGGTDGFINQSGPGAQLLENGTVPKTVPFFNGQFAAGPFSAVNYYNLTLAQSLPFKFDVLGLLTSVSFWLYYDALPVATETVWSDEPGSTMQWDNVTGKLVQYFNGAGLVYHSTVLLPKTWYNVVVSFAGPTSINNNWWVNGVNAPFTQSATDHSASRLRIGRDSTGASIFSGYLAQFIIYTNYNVLQADRLIITNNNTPIRFGPYQAIFMKYVKLGMAGQKLSAKLSFAKTTDADDIYASQFGALKVN
jgi:hypothetical protein